MSVELYRESPGKFDSKTLSKETRTMWTGRICLASSFRMCLNREVLKGRLPRRTRYPLSRCRRTTTLNGLAPTALFFSCLNA